MSVSEHPSSSNSNPWFGLSMGLFGLIVGYALAGVLPGGVGSSVNLPAQVPQNNDAVPSPSPPAPPADNVPKVDPKVDHIRGNAKAIISIIEYSDFECPFCQRHHPTMQQVLKEYGDDVNWVYRHFPLGFHQNAEPAALASECANEFGGNDGFWKFTDLIFEKGFDFAAHAKELGFDAAKFDDCVKSGKYKQHVQDDMSGGSGAGVDGTPGNIVLNNKTGKAELVSGAQPLANFKAAIDRLK